MAEDIQIDPDSLERHSNMIDSGSEEFDSSYSSFLAEISARNPWGEDEISLELAAQHDELIVSAEECFVSASESLHEAAAQLKQMAADWSDCDEEGASHLDDIDSRIDEAILP